MSNPLYEPCPDCDGTGSFRADTKMPCPECRGEKYVPIGLTLEEFERWSEMVDPLRSAATAAIPFVRTAILASAWSKTSLDPEDHPVLSALIDAVKGPGRPARSEE